MVLQHISLTGSIIGDRSGVTIGATGRGQCRVLGKGGYEWSGKKMEGERKETGMG